MSANQQPDLYTTDLLRVRSRVAGGAVGSGLEHQVGKSANKNRHMRSVERPVHEYAVADNEFFLHTLTLERKRCERSGKPFLLVLLRSSRLFQGNGGAKTVRQLQHSVFSTIREIDLAGWYEDEAALGIIFTELDEANNSVAAAILARVTQAITRGLDAQQAASIDITCHWFPSDSVDGGVTDDSMRFYPDVPRIERRRRSARLIKRTMDICVSLFALLVLAPVFLIIAALIKLTSKGPVFYRQHRVGQYGNMFTFLKFRSMYANNNSSIHQDYVTRLIDGNHSSSSDAKVFKITNDPRVTTIGRVLRRTSLDELPQFFNVLIGQMSLVGPRPPIPYELDRYDVWHRRRVLEVRPGITGLWQVSGRSKINFDDMVRLDLKYARRWSIAMDLKILWLTPKAVLSGDGAY
jgi:lipopolysaccharide/colanic/teichoic acid biosynthesis glycosyltransferase